MNTALIAGEGILPIEIARKLKELQPSTLILTLRKDDELKPFAGKLVRLRFPNMGRVIRELREFGADAVIMAGNVSKRWIYGVPVFFDGLTRKILRDTLFTGRDDHSLLGSIVKAFEDEGIKVLPYWQILSEFIASSGKLSERSPTDKEFSDIRYGQKILNAILPCSFGQSLSVADGAVTAVEAMEGTDKMIERSGEVAGRGVVVKMMKKTQDMRYDLPTVGTGTLERMHMAGLTCLAVEAGKTIILEPENFFNLAGKYKIAVWGLKNNEEEV
ncbi:MAG: UDP-2,3-diacylglucosamine diphosphatase LpxI [Synergistaceae bacterium]|nr:UDP-2,3-diacylglucosamine diphosphatase LpxI [Synergistaceae bacterium]